MRLEEVIKKDVLFKRPIHNFPWRINNSTGTIEAFNIKNGNVLCAKLHMYDILADDWEIEGERINLTAAQIEEAILDEFSTSYRNHENLDIKKVLADLGFKS